jgi:hypothetical protein
MLSLIPSITTLYAQNQEQANEKAQQFIELALQAKEKAYELKEFILENIGSLPDEIEDLLEMADTLLAEGNIQNAIQAMNTYRNAYKHLHQFIEQGGIDIETPEKAKGLLVAINRTYIRIEGYNNTLTAINDTLTEDQYLNLKPYFDCVQGNLTEAKDNLVLATESLWLEPPNIEWAAHNLTEANRNVTEAIHCLRMIAKGFNRYRIQNFLDEIIQFKEGLGEEMRERLQQGTLGDILENLGYSNLEDFNQAIDNLVQNAKEGENIKEAVEDLKTIVEILQEIYLNLPNRRGPP